MLYPKRKSLQADLHFELLYEYMLHYVQNVSIKYNAIQ